MRAARRCVQSANLCPLYAPPGITVSSLYGWSEHKLPVCPPMSGALAGDATMSDLIALFAGVGGFAAMLAYGFLCERI